MTNGHIATKCASRALNTSDVRKVKVKVSLLTPVHVGKGKEAEMKRNLDVFQDNGRTVFVNWDVLMQQLPVNEMKRMAGIVAGGNRESIKNTLLQWKRNYPSAFTSVPYRLHGSQFSPHIKTPQGVPYLPGSSMKGVWWTIFMTQQLDFSAISYKSVPDASSEWQNVLREPYLHAERRMGLVRSNRGLIISIENAITRHFRMPDIYFPAEQAEWWNTKVFGGSVNGHRHYGWKNDRQGGYSTQWNGTAFVQGVEAMAMRASSITEWGYEPRKCLWELRNQGWNLGRLFRNGFPDNPRTFWKNLFKWANTWMLRYLNREIEFFEAHAEPEHVDKVLATLRSLKSTVEEARQSGNTSAVLRVGFGSGFHAITGDWEYQDHLQPLKIHRRRPWYKTRKLIFRNRNGHFELYPLGFVKVALLPEDDASPVIRLEDCLPKAVEKGPTDSLPQNDTENDSREVAFEPPRPAVFEIPSQGKKKLNRNNLPKIEGEVIANPLPPFNKHHRLRVYIRRGHQGKPFEHEIEMTKFSNDLEKGTVVVAEVTQIDKNGLPSRCRYKDIKWRP